MKERFIRESLDSLALKLSPENDERVISKALSQLDDRSSAEVVESLKELCFYKSADIRRDCFFRVTKILRDQGTQFYAECLGNPMFRENSEAVFSIWRYRNEDGIPAMIKRLRQIISTRKGRPYCWHNGNTELTQCLEYLHPHRDSSQVSKVFQRMVDKWEILDKREVWWITDQLAYFDHDDLREHNSPMPSIVRFEDDDHPVFKACSLGDVEKVAELLDEGVSVYSRGFEASSLAKIAISNGNLELFKLLVSHGLEIERPIHGFRQFPILEALRKDKDHIVEYILEAGIDLNRCDEYGASVFATACCGIADPDQLRRMIELGGDLGERRSRGETPFIFAARAEALETMSVLLENGAGIDEKDDLGKTALIHCAQGGKALSVQWLIDHGADLTLSEGYDRDALYWAKENGHSEIVGLLQSKLDGN